MTRPSIAAVLLVLLAAPRTPLAAQRHVALLRLGGNSTAHARAEADPDRPAIRPDHPVAWELSAGGARGPWRAALRLRRSRADLAIAGATSAVLTRAAIRSWGLGVEAGRRIAGGRDGAAMHLLVGGLAERTTFPVTGGDARTTLVALAAGEGIVPVAARWDAVVRLEGGLGGALFGAEELPAGYATRVGRRWNVGLGLRWRP